MLPAPAILLPPTPTLFPPHPVGLGLESAAEPITNPSIATQQALAPVEPSTGTGLELGLSFTHALAPNEDEPLPHVPPLALEDAGSGIGVHPLPPVLAGALDLTSTDIGATAPSLLSPGASRSLAESQGPLQHRGYGVSDSPRPSGNVTSPGGARVQEEAEKSDKSARGPGLPRGRSRPDADVVFEEDVAAELELEDTSSGPAKGLLADPTAAVPFVPAPGMALPARAAIAAPISIATLPPCHDPPVHSSLLVPLAPEHRVPAVLLNESGGRPPISLPGPHDASRAQQREMVRTGTLSIEATDLDPQEERARDLLRETAAAEGSLSPGRAAGGDPGSLALALESADDRAKTLGAATPPPPANGREASEKAAAASGAGLGEEPSLATGLGLGLGDALDIAGREASSSVAPDLRGGDLETFSTRTQISGRDVRGLEGTSVTTSPSPGGSGREPSLSSSSSYSSSESEADLAAAALELPVGSPRLVPSPQEALSPAVLHTAAEEMVLATAGPEPPGIPGPGRELASLTIHAEPRSVAAILLSDASLLESASAPAIELREFVQELMEEAREEHLAEKRAARALHPRRSVRSHADASVAAAPSHSDSPPVPPGLGMGVVEAPAPVAQGAREYDLAMEGARLEPMPEPCPPHPRPEDATPAEQHEGAPKEDVGVFDLEAASRDAAAPGAELHPPTASEIYDAQLQEAAAQSECEENVDGHGGSDSRSSAPKPSVTAAGPSDSPPAPVQPSAALALEASPAPTLHETEALPVKPVRKPEGFDQPLAPPARRPAPVIEQAQQAPASPAPTAGGAAAPHPPEPSTPATPPRSSPSAASAAVGSATPEQSPKTGRFGFRFRRGGGSKTPASGSSQRGSLSPVAGAPAGPLPTVSGAEEQGPEQGSPSAAPAAGPSFLKRVFGRLGRKGPGSGPESAGTGGSARGGGGRGPEAQELEAQAQPAGSGGS